MNRSAPHVTVVDQQDQFASSVAGYLRSNGMRVTQLRTGRSLLELMTVDTPELVLLADWLPSEDSLSIARHVREHWGCGLIVATERDCLADRVIGLELGADDYITKGIDRRELLARVRTVVRRVPAHVTQPASANAAERNAWDCSFYGWRLDIATRSAQRLSDSGVATLTPGEHDLLCVLLRNRGRVLTREFIAECLSGCTDLVRGRTIDVQIGRLRKKLESDPCQPEIIRSVRGVGYVLTCG